MDTYDKTMQARFRGTLLRRAEELGRMLHNESLAAAEGVGHEVGDFKDVAVEDTRATIDEAQAAHAAVELQQVRAALQRIADNSYGKCADCGDPIDLRRLSAMPATAYCTSCQSVHEHERH